MGRIGAINLFILTSFFLTGCVTVGNKRYLEANTTYEQKLISVEEEYKFGHYVDAYIQNEYTVLDDFPYKDRVEDIFYKIAKNSDRPNLKYTLRILNSTDVNAFAGPGGYVYITTGLLDVIKSKDELAGVFAHEIGHICSRHIIKQFYGVETTKAILTILTASVAATSGDMDVANGISDLGTMVAIVSLQGYSRSDELQADSLAVKYTKKSGYNPLALIDLLRRMEEKREEETGRKHIYTILSSHPPTEIRAENIRKQLEFIRSGGLND